jgi:hypothetical protein
MTLKGLEENLTPVRDGGGDDLSGADQELGHC